MKFPVFFYADSIIKLAYGIASISLLTWSLSKAELAIYLFSSASVGYLALLTNASMDTLLHQRLGRVQKSQYFIRFSIYWKAIIYTLGSTILISMNIKNSVLILILMLSGLTIIIDQRELEYRFSNIYSYFSKKIRITALFFLPKAALCYIGLIKEALVLAVFEAIAILLLTRITNTPKAKLSRHKFSRLLRSCISTITTTTTSGGLIFLLLKIDLLFGYRYLDTSAYASYAFAARVSEIGNYLTNIVAKYNIPKLFTSSQTISKTTLILLATHTASSIALILAAYIYINEITPQYKTALETIPFLLFSGYFLITGQVRGTYFAKKGIFKIDIIYASIGIISFFLTIILFPKGSTWGLTISYLLAILTSGLLSSIFSKNGRDYLRNLFFKNG